MPANSDPIYTRAADIQSSALMNAVNASLFNAAGTIGTDVYKVWTADATNGGFLRSLRFKYVANATTTSVACVAKIFLTSASSGAVTDANCFLVDEINLPASGALSTTVSAATIEIPFGIPIPAGWSVVVKLTVAQPASCGWLVVGIGGKY